MSAPDDREDLTVEQAMSALLVVDGQVHCFLPAYPTPESIVLIGADWRLQQVREAFTKHGVEAAGLNALEMGHGVSVRKLPALAGGTMDAFFATLPEWNAAQLEKLRGAP